MLSRPSWRNAAVGLTAALILAAHAALAVSSMALKSVTNDELAHLPAGLAAVATGEVRLNPEHPPLVKLLAGAAAATLDPELPLEGSASRAGNQWRFGRRVLFESGNDHRALLFRARLPVVGLSLLGCLGVFAWTRRRFGAGAGLFSLALYAFSPTVLAHGRLVTMDAAVAAGVVWSLYLWWRLVGNGTGPVRVRRWARPWQEWAVCGAVLGLALAAKFSALLLLPAMAMVELVELATRGRGGAGPEGRRAARWGLRHRLGRWAVVLAVAAGVLQAVYLLPADPLRYLRDLGHLYQENDPDALHYLAGEFRSDGFPHYFLVALGVKTSLVALLAWAGGLVLAARRTVRRAAGWLDDLHLWAPALLWMAVHSAFAQDLGVRYMLPVYGLLAVLAGGIVPALGRLAPGDRGGEGAGPLTDEGSPAALRRGPLARAAPILALLLGLGQVSVALAAWPDYIPYFHRLAGGARGGPSWLHGANLDWGQDLGRLAPWLRDRGIGRVRLLYFGAGVPEAYGVLREPMLPSDWWESPRPGDYVVSAQYLVRGLHQARQTGAPTDWLRRYEPSGVLGGTLYLFRFPAPPAGAQRPTGEAQGAEGRGGEAPP
ncbi:MAG: glycosyltransferase family 39 protein [Thermoanaerobaculia bacterium]